MAGQALKRSEFGLLDAAGADEILDRIANGESLYKIAADANVRRTVIYQWLDARGLRERFQEARKLSATSRVDDAQIALEGATPESIGVVREKVKFQTWMAARSDRETYGDQTIVNHQINLGQTFVGLMRGVMEARGHALTDDGLRARDIVGSTQQQAIEVLVPRNTSDGSGG